MLVDINVDTLIKHKITANQFLIAYLISKENLHLLHLYIESNKGYNKADLEALVKARFIHNSNKGKDFDLSKISVRPKFENLIAVGDHFDELIALFPKRVRRTSGSNDYLRTDLNRCRKLYNKITKGRRQVHDHIMDCLRYELEVRRLENSYAYMKRIPKWLSSEE